MIAEIDSGAAVGLIAVWTSRHDGTKGRVLIAGRRRTLLSLAETIAEHVLGMDSED